MGLGPFVTVGMVALIVLSGCASGSGCLSNTGVANTPGSFSIGQQLAGCDGERSWQWQNMGTTARISLGNQVASGSLQLTITDSAGKSVYTRTFTGTSSSGSQGSTTMGSPGEWTITIKATDYTGNLGLTVTT